MLRRTNSRSGGGRSMVSAAARHAACRPSIESTSVPSRSIRMLLNLTGMWRRLPVIERDRAPISPPTFDRSEEVGRSPGSWWRGDRLWKPERNPGPDPTSRPVCPESVLRVGWAARYDQAPTGRSRGCFPSPSVAARWESASRTTPNAWLRRDCKRRFAR